VEKFAGRINSNVKYRQPELPNGGLKVIGTVLVLDK
jgi:hypothetical protein